MAVAGFLEDGVEAGHVVRRVAGRGGLDAAGVGGGLVEFLEGFEGLLAVVAIEVFVAEAGDGRGGEEAGAEDEVARGESEHI